MVCASRIMLAASSRVAGNRQMSSSVACVSALIGLKLKLPQTLSQISERMSIDTGALKPAALKASLMARMLGVSVPSSSPSVKRLPSMTLMTPGRITSLAGYTTLPITRSMPMCRAMVPSGSTALMDVPRWLGSIAAGSFLKYHQGMPFCMVTTRVSACISAGSSAAMAATWWAFMPRMMTS